jgi:hypothetical protein
MGALHISPEVFYDLSPVEFYYVLSAAREKKKAESQEAYEIARYEAFLIINSTSSILKRRLRDVFELGKFPWEEDRVQLPKKQTPEEMKQAVLGIAAAFGAKPKQEKDTPKK